MKATGSYIIRSVAGETVLVPTGKTAQEFNGMITLNEAAKFIWENLEKASSREELAQWLTEEYEVSYETAFRDVTGFVRELYLSGFIEPEREDREW